MNLFFRWVSKPKTDRGLILQSALMGYPLGIYMDLMLRVASRIGLHEILEVLETIRVKLGPISTQIVRSRVIFDVRWCGGIQDFKDYTFYLEVFPPSPDPCRGFPLNG